MASLELRSRGLLVPGRGKLFLVASDLFKIVFFMQYHHFFPYLLGIFVIANVVID